MKLEDLAPNPKNPRRITKRQLEGLKNSLTEFGDLSGIVFNRRTKQLVGGHQRAKLLSDDADIQITRRFDNPTASGTVAEGFVLADGERFVYREVDWDEKRETEALLAANKHGGEWDTDLLKLNFDAFPDLNFDLAGFDPPSSDEDYLKDNPGPDERLEKERISTAKPEPDEKKAAADLNPQWIVSVNLSGETEMQELFEELSGRGFDCKLIT